MPFDISAPCADSAILTALDAAASLPIAKRRGALVDIFERAHLSNPHASGTAWYAMASALVDVLPKPRATAQEPASAPWAEYSRFPNDFTRRRIVVRFADGEEIAVSLITPKGKTVGDYARAARNAVAFYKSRRWRNLCLAAFGTGAPTNYSVCAQMHMERRADAYAVPEIVALDDGCTARANAHTADLRAGADLGDALESAGRACGDMATAAHSVITDSPLAAQMTAAELAATPQPRLARLADAVAAFSAPTQAQRAVVASAMRERLARQRVEAAADDARSAYLWALETARTAAIWARESRSTDARNAFRSARAIARRRAGDLARARQHVAAL